MAREELEIEIDAHGRVTVHTIGFKGKKCLDQAEAIYKEMLDRKPLDVDAVRAAADFYGSQQKIETAGYAAEHQHHVSSDRARSTARR